MKKQSKFTLNKIRDFLTENTPIIVILLVLFSLASLMMIKGFRLDYESLDTDPPSSVLVEDRVPALARYYQRERINVTLKLANPSELEEGEVLDDINYEAKYNQNFIFSNAFSENELNVPTRENHLFTHFSLTPGGEVIDPGERITEPVTVYANWIPKPKVQPWQVLAKLTLQIELGTQTYVPYKYTYLAVNKGAQTNITLDQIPGLIISDSRIVENGYQTKINIAGTESKPIVEFKYNYNRTLRQTVTYDLNGGVLVVPTQRTEYSLPNNGLILESPGAKKDDHRFLGWSLDPQGNVSLLEDVVVKNNVPLYAIYAKSVAKPDSNSGQGRYQTTYILESIQPNTSVPLYSIENVANLNEEIISEEIQIPHFESVLIDAYTPKTMILGGQYLIVPKKDKVFNLNEKVMSFTEVNPAGVLVLLLMFGLLAWTFLDNRIYKNKFLYWGIILVITGIFVIVLPQFVRFSVYFKNIWEMSKQINAAGTKITPLSGIITSGVSLLVAAVFCFITYIILLVSSKKENKE